jgi:hypothetical protein
VKAKPLYVAASSEWTAQQTIEEYARSRGREVSPRKNEDGTFSFADGVAHYHVSIVSDGRGNWMFAVFPDPEETS